MKKYEAPFLCFRQDSPFIIVAVFLSPDEKQNLLTSRVWIRAESGAGRGAWSGVMLVCRFLHTKKKKRLKTNKFNLGGLSNVFSLIKNNIVNAERKS